MASTSKEPRINLPGFNAPLDYVHLKDRLFPNALDCGSIEAGDVGRINTQREILMMRVMNNITDKPEWDRKVFDEKITSRWRNEISKIGQDVTPKMMDWIIQELQWKAEAFRKTGIVPVFNAGVMKSDSAIPAALQEALKDAVRRLEHIPEDQKDYHPGSDGKVVDLIHPSLFPIVYGRSRILEDRTIGLDDCLSAVGQGKILPIPGGEGIKVGDRRSNPGSREIAEFERYSLKFQWMPCDVEFMGHHRCRIVSYINNLHPRQHKALYGVIESILARIIPLWDRSLTLIDEMQRRIEYNALEFEEPEPEADGDLGYGYRNRYMAWQRTRTVKQPEPGEFEPLEAQMKNEINLRERFRERGLQVIVKLANIELTPDKPDYEGGSWHVEGQLNEHICATAIYYYDSSNITKSTLSFRQRADTRSFFRTLSYPQGQHDFLHAVFGFGPDTLTQGDTQITQNLGSVVTQEGRLVTFPNILQHRVSPFSLANPSKPGHRKILALFLVDPNVRVISSANIPPQRGDWQGNTDEDLPSKIQHGANNGWITMKEAKAFRIELMDQRKTMAREQNDTFETGNFSLCEH